MSLLMLLDLSFNNLQGSIPTEIGLLSNLALSLNLSNNILEGELPVSIGNLASVKAMDLSENKVLRRDTKFDWKLHFLGVFEPISQ